MPASLTLEAVLDALADAVAKRVAARVHTSDGAAVPRPRLLTVEQGGLYCGRSKKAMEHLVAGKEVPVVKNGRRVFLDVKDLDRWIESNKELPEHWK